MKRSIVWFKTDLRLHDNETLIRAIEENDEIIPVYCIDEDILKLQNLDSIRLVILEPNSYWNL
jgi:deoxyribodipyrimidine photolyase